MFLEKINKTELKILKLVVNNSLSEKEIARALGLSQSWMSECVKHLSDMGFTRTDRAGITKLVKLEDNDIGTSLKRLIIEGGMLNLDHLLSDSGLLVLPLLLTPGDSIGEIARKTGLTKRAIHYKLRIWKGMGILDLKKSPDVITFNRRHNLLINFIIEYCRHRNQRYLISEHPESLIVWEWRDEFLFTTKGEINENKFTHGGPTRLNEFTDELITSAEYYYFSIGNKPISLEEALVQTVKLDPMNPRPLRLLKNYLHDEKIELDEIMKYARKYGVYRLIKGVV